MLPPGAPAHTFIKRSAPYLNELARGGALPAVSFVIPYLCNDIHDCSTSLGQAAHATPITNVWR
jgi:hypothetical protein